MRVPDFVKGDGTRRLSEDFLTFMALLMALDCRLVDELGLEKKMLHLVVFLRILGVSTVVLG